MSVNHILCPICHVENSALDYRCMKCGAFIQDRVPAVDLFATIFQLFDNPRAAFMRIARSEQKNYTYTLFFFSGYALSAIIAMIGRLGNEEMNFIILLGLFILCAPVAGLVLMPCISTLAFLLLKYFWQAPASFRNVSMMLAYSMIPIVISSVFVLPVEFALFGNYLFSDNPAPWIFKPTEFYLLASIDIIATGWSIFLVTLSFRSVYSLRLVKSIVTTLFITTTLIVALFLLGNVLRSMLS